MTSKQKSSEGEKWQNKDINKHNIIQITSSLLRKCVYTLKSTERKLESALMLGMCERRPCPGSVRLKTSPFSLSYWLVPLLRGEHTHIHTIIHHHTHSVLTMWWKILHLFSPSLLLDVCVCVCMWLFMSALPLALTLTWYVKSSVSLSVDWLWAGQWTFLSPHTLFTQWLCPLSNTCRGPGMPCVCLATDRVPLWETSVILF